MSFIGDLMADVVLEAPGSAYVTEKYGLTIKIKNKRWFRPLIGEVKVAIVDGTKVMEVDMENVNIAPNEEKILMMFVDLQDYYTPIAEGIIVNRVTVTGMLPFMNIVKTKEIEIIPQVESMPVDMVEVPTMPPTPFEPDESYMPPAPSPGESIYDHEILTRYVRVDDLTIKTKYPEGFEVVPAYDVEFEKRVYMIDNMISMSVIRAKKGMLTIATPALNMGETMVIHQR